jgi:hypothetical protein
MARGYRGGHRKQVEGEVAKTLYPRVWPQEVMRQPLDFDINQQLLGKDAALFGCSCNVYLKSGHRAKVRGLSLPFERTRTSESIQS